MLRTRHRTLAGVLALFCALLATTAAGAWASDTRPIDEPDVPPPALDGWCTAPNDPDCALPGPPSGGEGIPCLDPALPCSPEPWIPPDPGPGPVDDPPGTVPDTGERFCLAELTSFDPFSFERRPGAPPADLSAAFAGSHTAQATSICSPTVRPEVRAAFDAAFGRLFGLGCSQIVAAGKGVGKPDFLEVGYFVDAQERAGAPRSLRCYRFDVRAGRYRAQFTGTP